MKTFVFAIVFGMVVSLLAKLSYLGTGKLPTTTRGDLALGVFENVAWISWALWILAQGAENV